MYRCFEKIGFLMYQLTLGTKKVRLYEFETEGCLYWHVTQEARKTNPMAVVLEIPDENEIR